MVFAFVAFFLDNSIGNMINIDGVGGGLQFPLAEFSMKLKHVFTMKIKKDRISNINKSGKAAHQCVFDFLPEYF